MCVGVGAGGGGARGHPNLRPGDHCNPPSPPSACQSPSTHEIQSKHTHPTLHAARWEGLAPGTGELERGWWGLGRAAWEETCPTLPVSTTGSLLPVVVAVVELPQGHLFGDGDTHPRCCGLAVLRRFLREATVAVEQVLVGQAAPTWELKGSWNLKMGTKKKPAVKTPETPPTPHTDPPSVSQAHAMQCSVPHLLFRHSLHTRQDVRGHRAQLLGLGPVLHQRSRAVLRHHVLPPLPRVVGPSSAGLVVERAHVVQEASQGGQDLLLGGLGLGMGEGPRDSKRVMWQFWSGSGAQALSEPSGYCSTHKGISVHENTCALP